MKQRAALALLAIVCVTACRDDPFFPTDQAGSFVLNNACGPVLEGQSNRIYTFSKSASMTMQVDAREPAGDLVWTRTIPSAGGPTCNGAVDDSGNLIVQGDSLFSLSASNGATRWRALIGAVDIAIGSNNRVYVGTSSSVIALDATNGNVIWTRGVANRSGVALNGQLFALYGIRRAGAIAINPATGDTTWSSPFVGSRDGIASAIGHDEEIVVSYSADFFGGISSYSSTGALRWANTAPSPRQAIGSPIIDINGVYSAFSSNSATKAAVIAFSPTNGAVQWKYDFDRIESDIAIDADRVIYVIARTTPDSVFQLYGIRDGAIVSSSPAPDIGIFVEHPITIHSNKLLYFTSLDRVYYIPTAGVTSAAWPMSKHDSRRTNRKPSLPLG